MIDRKIHLSIILASAFVQGFVKIISFLLLNNSWGKNKLISCFITKRNCESDCNKSDQELR